MPGDRTSDLALCVQDDSAAREQAESRLDALEDMATPQAMRLLESQREIPARQAPIIDIMDSPTSPIRPTPSPKVDTQRESARKSKRLRNRRHGRDPVRLSA